MVDATKREVLAAIGMAVTGISTTMTAHAAADDVERPVEMHDGEHTIIAHDCAHFEHLGPDGTYTVDPTITHHRDGEVTQSSMMITSNGYREIFVNCHAEEMRDQYDLWDGQGSIVIESVDIYDYDPIDGGYVAHFEWPQDFRCDEVVHEDIHPWVEEEICSEYNVIADAIGEGPVNTDL